MGTNATNPKEVSSDVPLSKSGETATNLNGASKGNGNGKDKTATAETQTGKPSAGSSAANRKPKPRCRSLGPSPTLRNTCRQTGGGAFSMRIILKQTGMLLKMNPSQRMKFRNSSKFWVRLRRMR